MKNKRNATRVLFNLSAEVMYNDTSFECEILNISLQGILLRSSNVIPVDSSISLNIHLTGTTSELSVKIDGSVVRSENEQIAIQFLKIDLDSFIHLKNIVAYNEGDADKIIQEFHDIIKKKPDDM